MMLLSTVPRSDWEKQPLKNITLTGIKRDYGVEERKKSFSKSAGHMSEEREMPQQEQLSPYLTSGLMFAQEGSEVIVENEDNFVVFLGSPIASLTEGFR